MPAKGIGVVFNSTVPGFLRECPGAVDYVELIPEMLWTDHGRGSRPRFVDVPLAVAELAGLAVAMPVVGHGIGLSIGSAMPLDFDYLARMREVIARWKISRFSEHLGFTRVEDGQGADRHIGLGMPVPCDEDVLEWLIPRVVDVQRALGIQVIFENGVRHTPFSEQDMSEPVFMNRLAGESGCGMLLDLHNLYVDCRNNGWQAEDYLAVLNFDLVREIHVAGGSMVGDVYTDSHAGPSPQEVWDLLGRAAPVCRNLEGITFEFHDSHYPGYGPLVLRAELQRLRDFWRGLDVA